MAQRTIIELTDDLTGEPADETIQFAFEGKSYALDLTTRNADKFRKMIGTYTEVARRDSAAGRARSNGHVSGVDPKAVRAWATDNGYQVSARGRVSGDLVAAFRAAGN